MEITYDQGSESIDHEFRKFLIENNKGLRQNKLIYKSNLQCNIEKNPLRFR